MEVQHKDTDYVCSALAFGSVRLKHQTLLIYEVSKN